jgi:hypothetical protein
MAAPTPAALVKKVLANPEPSTHGPSRPISYKDVTSPFGGEAEVNRAAESATSVENDPPRTCADSPRHDPWRTRRERLAARAALSMPRPVPLATPRGDRENDRR